MKEIKITAVFGRKSDIKGKPEFPICTISDGAEEWYLMPFRSYCMGINSEEEGDGFMLASTRAIPFAELKWVSNLMKVEYLRTSAATCLLEFARARDAVFMNKTKFDWEPDEAFREFIKASFKYIWPDEEWPYID